MRFSIGGSRFLLLFFAIFSLLIVYCIVLHIPIQMFRAESGIFMEASVSPDVFDRLKPFLIHNYNQHYTPIFFALEAIFCWLCTTHDGFWLLLQYGILALLLTTLVAACVAVRDDRGTSGRMNLAWVAPARIAPVWPYAVSAAIIFGCEPAMIDLAAWPFMTGQMVCLALFAGSVVRMSAFLSVPTPGGLWWTLALAYASMHFFGVGLAFSAAALVTTATFLILNRNRIGRPRGYAIALAAFSVLTVLHAAMMMQGSTASGFIGVLNSAVDFGVITIGSLDQSVSALWSSGGFPFPYPRTFAAEAVYGWAVWGIFILFLWNTIIQDVRRAALLAYCGLSFFIIAAMTTFRLSGTPLVAFPVGYIIGSRYFIFPSVLLIIGIFATVRLPATGSTSGTWIPSVILAAAALVSGYAFYAIPTNIWPWSAIDEAAFFEQVAERTRSDMAAGRPVQVIDMKDVGNEFPFTSKNFEHLILQKLGLPSTRVIQWSDSPAIKIR